MNADLPTTIYGHLNTLCDGIEQFVRTGREDHWYSPTYKPFVCNVLFGRRVMFGFWTEYGGDLCPDPAFSVTLGDGAADLESVVIDNILGDTPGGADGNAADCAEFLQERVQRKASGMMARVDIQEEAY